MAETVSGIFSALSGAGETIKKLSKIGGIIEHGDTIRELHEQILSGIAAARLAQTEITDKQNQIDSLSREIASLKRSTAQLGRYELKQLPPGVFVMALKNGVQPPEPFHYACEMCFGDDKVRRLQQLPGRHNGIQVLICYGCKTEYEIGDYIRPQPVQTKRYNPLSRWRG